MKISSLLNFGMEGLNARFRYLLDEPQTKNNPTTNSSDTALRTIATKVTVGAAAAQTVKKPDWQAVGEWTTKDGVYRAEVVAQKDTTLPELARLVTGNEADWTKLGVNNEKVAKGTKVDVSPLLRKMESDLRIKMDDLRKQLKTNFPRDGNIAQIKASGLATCSTADAAQNKCQNIGTSTINSRVSKSEAVNHYFTAKERGFRDCQTAVQTIYAKAVLETVGKQVFDQTMYSPEYVPLARRTVADIKDTKNGDWVQFRNYEDYVKKVPLGAWQAENTIKVGEDSYWGHGTEDKLPKTEADWLKELKKVYADQTGTPLDKLTKPLPGFDKNDVNFIDVAQVARDAFEIRAAEASVVAPPIRAPRRRRTP